MRSELLFVMVLAGAAWADGEIAAGERDVIDRAASELSLTDEERATLGEVLIRPMGVDETEALAREFLDSATPEGRADLLRRLGALLHSDGLIDATERKLLSDIEGMEGGREAAPVPLLNRMRRIFTAARPATDGGAPLVQQIATKLRPTRVQKALDPGRFEHAVLFGAILYRVAFADGKVDDMELMQVRSLLTGIFGFNEAETAQILSVVASRASEEMDRQRLCASFNRVASMEERLRLLGCLFAVAKADGRITETEMREIRLTANYLWIDARQFNDVRLRQT